MNSITRIFGLIVVAAGLAAAVPAARGQDEVSYLDRARKEATIYGEVQSESPSRIVILPRQQNAPKEIAVADLIDVHYYVATAHRLELQSAINSEKAAEAEVKPDFRRKLLRIALGKYHDLARDLREAEAKRHAEFKAAKLMALEADIDPASAPAAIDQLGQFIRANPESWQLPAAATLRARQQLSQGDTRGAQQTYEDLASRQNIAPETARAAKVRVLQLVVRAKKYDEAEAKIAELMRGQKADDLQTQRLQVLSSLCKAARGKPEEAIASLQSLVRKISDPAAKAEAYNALGDCYRELHKPAEARWPYLTVDVLYRQDRDEHARALYELVAVFRELKDDTRAAQFRDELQKDGRLIGTEYQRRLDREK